MSKIERRCADGLELRDSESGSTLVGTAVKWGAWSKDLGGFRERFNRGAFADSLGGDIVALRNHDTDQIIGRTPDTLKVWEDDDGLRFRIQVADTTVGRDLLESVRRRDIRGVSFAFVMQDEDLRVEDGEMSRTVKRAQLRDVSPVTFPAYPDTDVAVRSIQQWVSSQTAEVVAAYRERELTILEAMV